MNLRAAIARPTTKLLAGLCLVAAASLAIGWTAASVSASSGSNASATTSRDGGSNAAGSGEISILPQSPSSASRGSGTATSIAYPLPGYSALGAAPEGTILAQGTGTATMKFDGSDRTAALKKATDAALSAARARALAIASSMGVQLKDVYSVSVDSNENYAYPTPACLMAPLKPGVDGGPTTGGSSGSTGGAKPLLPSASVVCAGIANASPSSAQLNVTLVVAYKFA